MAAKASRQTEKQLLCNRTDLVLLVVAIVAISASYVSVHNEFRITGLTTASECQSFSNETSCSENVCCSWNGETCELSLSADWDGDGVCNTDGQDTCPDDPNKIDPGICGCGVPDVDSDGDGTFDCNDGCPDDPNKVDPGMCGCWMTDTDSDNDGTPDCYDSCPDDPNKTDWGMCGCGFPDIDFDNDGLLDCFDNCPNDPQNDIDGDWICGDVDNCPWSWNSDQSDYDWDGVGDACDSTINLPETGQTICYDETGAVRDCAETGEDGEKMAGIGWPNPRFIDNDDETIGDVLTHLIWAKDANLMPQRDVGWDTDNAADDGKVTWQHALDYIAKLNAENYLGYSDWRLPNINELASLVNAEQGNQSAWLIDQGFADVRPDYYWTSTTSSRQKTRAWIVYMVNGNEGTNAKAYDRYVWPVRGYTSGVTALPKTGQISCYDSSGMSVDCAGTGEDGEFLAGYDWPEPRFITPSSTRMDTLTGLEWSPDGSTPTTNGCNGGAMTWQNALDYIECLNTENYLGYNDWRLPNRAELRSLTNYEQPKQNVWLNGQGFTDVQNNFYWASTSYAVNPSSAWNVELGAAGNVDGNVKSTAYYVLPVRGGNEGGPDADTDGIPDGIDNCPNFYNLDQTDYDGDGIGDECDVCPNDNNNDADGDGVCGDVDNCPFVANPDQLDSDGDGLGDVCDNCVNTQNEYQTDSDGDGIGDECDVCPNDNSNDADEDGICGYSDNCPNEFNLDQNDTDGDGIGDACDNCVNISNYEQSDADGDVFGDACDNCKMTGNANQKDGNNDGIGAACTPAIASKIAKFSAGEGDNFMDGVVGNFVPDGKREIAAITLPGGGTLFVLDDNGNVVADFAIGGRALAAGDVDGDGIDEIAFGAEDGSFGVIKYITLSDSLEILWQQWLSCAITDIEIADVVPAEAGNEVVAIDGCGGATTVIANGLDGTLLGVQYAGGSELAIADVVGSEYIPDGFKDIVGAGTFTGLGIWDIKNDNTAIIDSNANGLAVWAGNVSGIATVFASSGTTLGRYRIAGYNGMDLDNLVVDIDVVETTDRTIVAALTNTPMTMYGIDFDANEIVWQAEIGGYYPDYSRSLDLLKHGDIDLDSKMETIVGGFGGVVYVLDSNNGEIKYRFDTAEIGGGHAIENIDLADMNNDGTLDIIAEQDGSVFGVIIYMTPVAGAEEIENVEVITTAVENGTEVNLTSVINETAGVTVPIVVSFVIPTGETIDMAPVKITAVEGLTIIRNLTLPAGVTKSAQVVMPSGKSAVCVDDTDGASLSANCNAAGEVAVPCPGSASGFTCTIINATLFAVSGLTHSAIGSYTPSVSAPSGPSGTMSNVCTPETLSCTDWNACSSSSVQQRTCAIRNSTCDRTSVIQTQSCTYVPAVQPPAVQPPIEQPVAPPVTPAPIPTATVCGNRMCEAGEDATNCPTDCAIVPWFFFPGAGDVVAWVLGIVTAIILIAAIFIFSGRYAKHKTHFHHWFHDPSRR